LKAALRGARLNRGSEILGSHSALIVAQGEAEEPNCIQASLQTEGRGFLSHDFDRDSAGVNTKD
jgi:hypothetical protein